MKLLLVNNDSDTWYELYNTCVLCGYDVTPIGCRDLRPDTTAGFDIVVLSGGYWYEDELEHLSIYKYELELIRQAVIPVIGICLGMQLMHVAFSGEVPLLDKPQSGLQTISITAAGQSVFDLPSTIMVHKNHTHGVINALPEFEVLGTSPGHIEIMRHKKKPLIGVQYHPEIGDANSTVTQLQMLANCLLPVPAPSVVEQQISLQAMDPAANENI